MWEVVPDESVLLFDRGGIGTARIQQLISTGNTRHFVTFTGSFVEETAENDALNDVSVSITKARKGNATPSTIRLRRIQYQINGHEPSALLTSLLCAETYSAQDFNELYHERWDIELAYRDIEQTQLQRLESLRSVHPTGSTYSLSACSSADACTSADD